MSMRDVPGYLTPTEAGAERIIRSGQRSMQRQLARLPNANDPRWRLERHGPAPRPQRDQGFDRGFRGPS